MERLLRATINTWHGLLAAARSEEAFRLELIAVLLAVPVAFLVAEQAWKRLALIAVVALVLVVELLNTAIEKRADRVNLAIEPEIAGWPTTIPHHPCQQSARSGCLLARAQLDSPRHDFRGPA